MIFGIFVFLSLPFDINGQFSFWVATVVEVCFIYFTPYTANVGNFQRIKLQIHLILYICIIYDLSRLVDNSSSQISIISFNEIWSVLLITYRV
jgi:hypothetical protein